MTSTENTSSEPLCEFWHGTGLARSPAPGLMLLPCLPAAAGHPGSERFQGLRRAPRVAAARAIACGGLAHRGGGQRGRGARSRRDGSRACPAARTRERLPGRVPHPWPPPAADGVTACLLLALSGPHRAGARIPGVLAGLGAGCPPAARVTSPVAPPSLLTADRPGPGGRVIRGTSA